MDERLFQSGEWWKRSYWTDKNRKVYCPYPEEDIVQALDTLKPHFDAAWSADIATSRRQNIIFPQLCIGEATDAIGFVIYLGQMFRTLKDSDGFNRLLFDLKGDKSESALLECEAAYAFADAGFKVHFPAEGRSKSPDVMVDFEGSLLAIECKRLRDEVWEDWESLLTSKIISGLPDNKDGKQIAVDVVLNPKLTQVFMGEPDGAELNNAFLDAIVEEVVAKITDTVLKNDVPFDINTGELASAHVKYQEEDGYGSVSGMPRASPPDHPPCSPERRHTCESSDSRRYTWHCIRIFQIFTRLLNRPGFTGDSIS